MAAITTDEIQSIYSGLAKNYECPALEDRDKNCLSSIQEEIDEEPDLTSLTWLTELRNQNITFSNTFNMAAEDENKCIIQKDKCLSVENIRHNFRSKQIRPAKLTSASNQMQAPIKRATPAERYKIFLEKVQRDLFEYKKSATSYQTNSAEKPPFNYSHIIGMAMLENGRVTLQQICNWIEEKFAFFRIRKKWNNSIRHNLSLHYCFRKIDRNKFEKGKGGYWELGVDPKKCERKRIRNRKTKRVKYDNARDKLTNSDQNDDSNQTKISKTSECAEKMDVSLLASLTDGKNLQNNLMMDYPVTQRNIVTAFDQASDNETQSQHFHLGTIIINSTETELSSASLNFLENNYDWSIQHHNLSTPENETMQESEHFVPAFTLDTELQNQNILLGQLNIVPGSSLLRPNVIVEQVLQPNVSTFNTENVVALPLPVLENSSTILNGINDNFRPYVDGIEEAFQYLRSIDQNNREDILDNILDISVSDY